MTYCHECGSEVAENDVFCPYCGITLQPVVVGGDDDAAFESTIMMPKPGASSTDIPVPAREIKSGQGNAGSGGELPLEDPQGSIKTDESIPAGDLAVPRAAGTPLEDADTQEQIEGAYAAAEEKSSESQLPTLEDVPVPDILRGSGDEPSSELQRAAPGTSDQLREPSEDLQPAADGGISRPQEDLGIPDSFSAQSMFDSVRIMESKPVEPRSEERPQPGPGVSPPEPVIKPQPAAAVQNSAIESKGPQHTAPNIGLIDTDGRKASKLKPLDEGTVLNGRYEIIRKIGGGGMGAVYLASDNNLGGVLRAVKEMVQSYIEEEQQEKAVEDFKRESMILSTLDHPSIPTIFDYFYDEKESRFYLVMKYISGGDLSARLRSAPEGRIDEKSVTEWSIQIADVLDYLHNHPTTIVYRDLKPSNIMIDGNTGRIMLIDFGIARSIGQVQEKGVTAVGTMGYAPPELFSGNVEPRSDIYSLGSTMFHLLTGADPQSNPLLIFDFQKNPRPRQINPQLSDQIERILMRSVEYSAQARFTSAAEMRRTLEDHLQNLKRGSVSYGVKEIPASVSLSNQNVFCGFCGQKIVATDMFCAFCGSKQPLAQQGIHSEIYTPSRLTATLHVTGTSELEASTFDLEKAENLIGRRDPMSNIFPEVDLSRYDPQTKISRRHARIWREGNDFMVEDLGSSNGTVLVAGAKESMRLMPHQPRPLTNGDRIKVGDTTLHFVVG
jgi:serine/threonine-protein kinase